MPKYYFWGSSNNPVDVEDGYSYEYVHSPDWEGAAVRAAWVLFRYDEGVFRVTLQDEGGEQRTFFVDCEMEWQAKVTGEQHA